MDQDREFLGKLAQLLQLPAGSLTDADPLDAAGWDSIEDLSAIALIDKYYGRTVALPALKACRSVRELLDLVHAAGSS